MIRLLSVLFLLIATALGATYDGIFKLSEAINGEGESVPLVNGKPFVLVVRSESPTHYAMSLRLGNSLRCDMKVSPSTDASAHDRVHVGDVMSTMMMPPENIFKVEQFLTSYLPNSTDIYLSDDGDTLTLEGDGKIVFAREDSHAGDSGTNL